MGLFDKLKDPIFLKETSSAKQQLTALQALVDKVEEQDRKKIEQEMRLIEYGIKGEEQIAFELKNSHMPMYILHDLYFDQDGLSAQIDYMIITRKCTFVLECKNLFGDITINQNGDFIRSMTFSGRTVKEGIYSPVTQNKRHMEMIKAMCLIEKKNILAKTLFAKLFDEYHQSVVVLANPKTILKSQYAPKEVKQQVIRADQLVEYIKKVNNTGDKITSSEKDAENLAKFFLSKHIEKMIDYSSKYTLKDEKENQSIIQEQAEPIEEVSSQEEGANELLIKQLKTYRLEQSRQEKVKPYFIFNDKQMMALIEKYPTTLEELIQVSGFGEVKCQKYGEAILKIFQSKE